MNEIFFNQIIEKIHYMNFKLFFYEFLAYFSD